MLDYDLKLAWQSLRRHPGLSALMVIAVALGIAVCTTAFTIYHAVSRNPIQHKNDQLYAVTIDSWDATEPASEDHPELPPPQLTYRDATALLDSQVPTRTVVMFKSEGVLDSERPGTKPFRVILRVTTGGFFPAFETPFAHGSGWDAAADQGPQPVIVLSHETNLKAFGGENSVGRTLRLGDNEFRVVGVLAPWDPDPKFYDVNNGAFQPPEDAYIPFRWTPVLELLSVGNNNCWKSEALNSYRDYLNSECVWIQAWIEVPDAATRDRYQAELDNYVRAQKALGRLPRPLNNRLHDVQSWLQVNEVVEDDQRVLVGLALMFLAVCLVNVVGLLLAKFLNGAPLTGVRRALGASRGDIVRQHLTEVLLIGLAGGVLGLALASAGLAGIRAIYGPEAAAIQALTSLDLTVVFATLALSLVAGLAAGFYPAWRAGRTPPALYLKSQ